MIFRSAFIWCYPIRQEILHVSQIAIAFYGMSPPFIVHATVPQMCQKSFLASPSYDNESWSGVEEDPSDFPWKLLCSSLLSGRSRVKVDVFGRFFSPNYFDCPICHWDCDAYNSFAVSFFACMTDASICCNSWCLRPYVFLFHVNTTPHMTKPRKKTWKHSWTKLMFSICFSKR